VPSLLPDGALRDVSALRPSGVTQDTVLILLRGLGFDPMEIDEFGTSSVAVCRREPA